MTDLFIRRYRADDYDAVWELQDLALPPGVQHAPNRANYIDLDQIETVYLDGGDFLIGELAGWQVAIGGLQRTDEERAEIRRMRVHPAVRRRGYGRKILDALEARAFKLGFRTLHLDTTTIQPIAQALYRGAGFVEVGRGRIGRFELIYFEKNIVPSV